MLHTSSVAALRDELAGLRRRGLRVALVPTMGNLHEGHLALVRLAQQHADCVVCSIFVNPTQFGPNEDLSRYPRPLEHDLELARENGASIVFHPTDNAMYPSEPNLSISILNLADHLCGRSRPGHFNGVLQVVNKLFNIIQPDVALFGQKDIQQFRLIETMVDEFNHPIELIRAETIREADGLALSSRNTYLSAEDRSIAAAIIQQLRHISDRLTSDTSLSVSTLCEDAIQALTEIGFKNDYLSVVDYASLTPVQQVERGKVYVIAAAQFLGTTRLIDNVILQP